MRKSILRPESSIVEARRKKKRAVGDTGSEVDEGGHGDEARLKDIGDKVADR